VLQLFQTAAEEKILTNVAGKPSEGMVINSGREMIWQKLTPAFVDHITMLNL
jgi:hypothetical protein